MPVYIPTPGEYVSEGAAIQAAWALHQQRPIWSDIEMEQITAKAQPEVLERYLAAIGSI